jgi:hypothetical protein
MARQLVLIEGHRADWRLDDQTKELGRKGVADARRQLQEAVKRTAA